MTTDYGQTIHLPKTDFPRRAGLAQKEPEIQKRWDKMGLYAKQRALGKTKEKFILHMGPPFANGHIHLGHVLSTVLKDIVCRSYQMMGYESPLVPGFDCHGLPIEWKVEEEFRKNKSTITKDSDRVGFIKACRDFAAQWIGVQSQEFQRLGILADWANPYKTMDKKAEAAIASTVHEFLRNGALYRGTKPVMWSIPEQTALAEAEIEYKDITSDTAWVKFPIKKSPIKALEGASVVIWTTTPWTLPGNRAVAYGEEIEYVAVKMRSEKPALDGNTFIVARALLPELQLASGCVSSPENEKVWSGKGSDLKGTICHHPLHGKGYDFDVPLLAGDFVTTDTGTGFVHIAPGHGEDDHRLGVANGIEVPETVAGDGKYVANLPLFAGAPVYTPEGKKGPANKFVLGAIEEAGNLVAKAQITHSYPHSWRSKAPVIFRTTPQWFVSMAKNDLRAKALKEIEKTHFFPAKGKNRIGAMVEGRGDWCVSRQRVWGVPLTLFVNKETLQPLLDENVNKRIVEIFEKEGSDAWFNRPAEDFLGSAHKADDYIQVKDIVDVWMESGITQDFVLKARPELQWPADLYLEGSDQHRGWFQSSLLVGVGTHGNAPYKNILTHGFILDEKGYKMSKSEGNVTSPTKLMELYGADILRLWAASSDYTEDTRFGENILKGNADVYRRIRGTFCYLLGSLSPFEKVDYAQLSDLDKWVLHKLHEIDGQVRASIRVFDFSNVATLVHNFCAKELSAFYFDVCKDALYCEDTNAIKRRAILTTLDHVFNYLVHWLSPVLCFTAEEAWLSYKGLSMDDASESIHLSVLQPAPASWENKALDEKWQKVLEVRSAVTAAMELKRADKFIGASLEAAPKVHVGDTALAQILKSVDFADVCITSGIEIIQGGEGISVTVEKATGEKCARCWKYTPEVGTHAAHPALCSRCNDAVTKQNRAAA